MPSLILLESSFDPPATDADLDAIADQIGDCLDVRGVRWLHSYQSLDGKRRICVFEAADAEAVRDAYRTAGVKFDRVWSAEMIRDDEA